MFSRARRIVMKLTVGAILFLSLASFIVLPSSCAGFALSFSHGGIFPSLTTSRSYYYISPYAYIVGYRFYVYDSGSAPFVIYLGVPYYIRIYADVSVWAPRALVILLE